MSKVLPCSTTDILQIANILVVLSNDDRIQSHNINKSNIKKYCRNKITICEKFATISGKNTATTLLKSLSYFVEMKNDEYINIILQAIDIFTNHIDIAFSLHKEILKIAESQYI